MTAHLRNARKALRAAATCLRQSAGMDTLDKRTRDLVLLQALTLDAESNTVDRRIVDAHEHRAELRRNRTNQGGES